MGAGLVLVFWLILGGVALGLSVAGIAILRTAWRRSRPLAAFGAVATAVGLTAFIGVGVILVSLFVTSAPRTSASLTVFKDVFGFSAGGDVTDFTSYSVGSTDFALSLLRFRCARSTVAAITSKHFTPAPPSECLASMSPDSGSPQWWQPTLPQSAECYSGRRSQPHTPSDETREQRHLLYDPSSRTCYYRYHVVD